MYITIGRAQGSFFVNTKIMFCKILSKLSLAYLNEVFDSTFWVKFSILDIWDLTLWFSFQICLESTSWLSKRIGREHSRISSLQMWSPALPIFSKSGKPQPIMVSLILGSNMKVSLFSLSFFWIEQLRLNKVADITSLIFWKYIWPEFTSIWLMLVLKSMHITMWYLWR